MDMEVHVEEVVSLLRRPRKGKEDEDVDVTAGAGDDVKVNESPSGMNGELVVDEEEEEEEEEGEEKGGGGWVGAVVNRVGEGGHPDKHEEDEVIIMQGELEKTDSWEVSGVRGFFDDEQEEVLTFRLTDSTAVEECTLDTAEGPKSLDEQASHGSSFESLKDYLSLENGAEVEVISGLLHSNVEGITIHKHSNGVVGMGGEAVILEEAYKEATLEEDNTEETKYDVENVLEKQNTHDLFCPNCKSCITKRVILCRKRHKVRNLRYRIKVDKVEQAAISASNSKPVVTSDDRNVVSGTATDTNEDRISVANEETTNREVEINEDREVFRCLSCLRFFICTGDGPKLFWNFGGKKLGEDVQALPQELPPAKTNAFFSFFTKRKVAVEQDETAVEEPRNETMEISNSLITNETRAHQNVVSLDTELTTASTKDAVDSSMDSDKKAAKETSPYAGHYGISTAMKGGLGEDDTLLKDTVEESPSLYQVNSLLSEHVVEKTSIKIEQTIEGKVKKREPSKAIQPSSSASWVLGQTHIEIDHTTVMETAKPLSAAKGLSTIPEGLTSVPQSSLSEDGAAIVNLLSAPGKQLAKEIEDLSLESAKILQDAVKKTIDDVIVVVESTHAEEEASQSGTQTIPSATQVTETGQARELEIVKSLVYGGLIESITSLGIVSSAAGGGASTRIDHAVNTLALALANLFGGLFVIAHNLRELKNEQPSMATPGETQDRYAELLGNRRHVLLHATIVILSFVVFGAVAPVTYAFSFRKSDSRDYKLAAVAAASLSCILLLAIGKAYARRPLKSYLKTISYYIVMGVTASGISFLVGELFDYLLQKLGWFSSTSSFSGPLSITAPAEYGFASY